jgi:putative phosphoribosyl transferase
VLYEGKNGFTMRFKDRAAAGKLLAAELSKLELKRPVVLALPRGGVPVGRVVADALHAPLDLVLVRKIGVPWQSELAAGSIVNGERPEIVFNEHVMSEAGLAHRDVEQAAAAELREIERRRELYLRGRQPVDLKGRDAVIVDDGIATGATFKAAIRAVRRRSPSCVIAAVPVAPRDGVAELKTLADEVICLFAPVWFHAIGSHYDDFRQLTDRDVIHLLNRAVQPEGGANVAPR